ncbi:MAG TPA: riboflavin synthase [Acidobacteriaceae bacterium]|jgi:riboflavin synthase|nr:riboflavin synthase [Acidobacteriaceae bacterium]
MFTGLIETTGTVVSLTPTGGATRIVLAAPALAGRWRTGDSIAVNGVCLTAIPLPEPTHFAADLAAETLARTTLGSLPIGATINLELPTPAGSPLGGHVVQGHVDATGKFVSIVPLHSDLATTDWRLTLELPDQLTSQVISQGSITVDGISLTVASVELPRIEIAVIPHTYKSTNLHTLTPGSPVNLETDALAKYAAAQRTHAEEDWLTPAYLLANGY